MATITTVSTSVFSLDGVNYINHFIVLKSGDNIRIVNAYDSAVEILAWTNFASVTVDGASFASVDLLIAGLASLLFVRSSAITPAEFDDLDDRVTVNEAAIDGLAAGYIYSIPQPTYTPATTPAPTVDGVYKVTEAGTFTNFGGKVVASLVDTIAEITVSDIGGTPVYTLHETDVSLTIDSEPTEGSTNVPESGGTHSYINTLKNKNTLQPQGFYTLSGGVGATVTLTVTDTASVHNALLDCVEGDRFYVQAKGAASGRLYAFLDASNVILEVGESNQDTTVNPLVLIAPVNTSKVIFHNNVSTHPDGFVTPYSSLENSLKDLVDAEFQIYEDTLKLPLDSITVGGNFQTGIEKDFDIVYSTLDVIESIGSDYLSKISCDRGAKILRQGSGNYESYIKANDISTFTSGQSGKYFNFRFYAFNSVVDEAPDRVRLTWEDSAGTTNIEFTTDEVNVTQLTANIFEISGSVLWTLTGSLIEFRLECTWLSKAELPIGTDIYITGYSALWATAFYKNRLIRDNWETNIETSLSELSGSATYNNKQQNISSVSNFLRKYQIREVDAFDQLTIVMVGDSIFGRMTDAEMSITQDTNGGVGDGFTTGHYPPNMWNENIAYKLLTNLQYKNADVKYYNHVASEVTKNGAWTTVYPLGADALRVATTQTLGDYIELEFTGATYAKFIYSTYNLGGVKTRQIKVTISDDGGTTYYTPAELGLTESIPFTSVSGEYFISADDYKFGNYIYKGFNLNTTYKLRVEKNDAVANPISAWGFETWSKPRINIVVTAEGGNTAGNQLTYWQRFYSEMYDPSLIIYELPYLNDLGTGVITQFKGSAIATTTPSGSPAVNDFWYASEFGIYTNFSGVTAKEGQYIQYNGSSWEIGSNELDTDLGVYHDNNKAVFERLKVLGVDVLTLVTHDGTSTYPARVFMYNEGMSILRALVSRNGFGSIDINRYQKDVDLGTIVADGVHLNDNGVTIYSDQIIDILNPEYSTRFVGAEGSNEPRKLQGSDTGAGSVSFGFQFSSIPKVRIYNNSTIVITEITKSDFTVTGTGAFDYEVFV